MQNRKCHSIFCKFPSQNGKNAPCMIPDGENRKIEILCDDTISHTQIFSNSNTALGHKQKKTTKLFAERSLLGKDNQPCVEL